MSTSYLNKLFVIMRLNLIIINPNRICQKLPPSDPSQIPLPIRDGWQLHWRHIQHPHTPWDMPNPQEDLRVPKLSVVSYFNIVRLYVTCTRTILRSQVISMPASMNRMYHCIILCLISDIGCNLMAFHSCG